jgi:hypothetical protein
VNSHELRVGDQVIGQDGSTHRIARITQVEVDMFPVSNLTIQDKHNYVVGPRSILVHNTEKTPRYLRRCAGQSRSGFRIGRVKPCSASAPSTLLRPGTQRGAAQLL